METEVPSEVLISNSMKYIFIESVPFSLFAKSELKIPFHVLGGLMRRKRWGLPTVRLYELVQNFSPCGNGGPVLDVTPFFIWENRAIC